MLVQPKFFATIHGGEGQVCNPLSAAVLQCLKGSADRHPWRMQCVIAANAAELSLLPQGEVVVFFDGHREKESTPLRVDVSHVPAWTKSYLWGVRVGKSCNTASRQCRTGAMMLAIFAKRFPLETAAGNDPWGPRGTRCNSRWRRNQRRKEALRRNAPPIDEYPY